MNWKLLTDEDQLENIKTLSSSTPQLIFKHSTRCSISGMAKNRLERSSVPDGIDFYYLDLLKYRNISSKLETDFIVHHESPQVLLIINGECVYDESHSGISMDEIEDQVKKQSIT
ncbi:MAG: bacillithiol system redox-active protein YtxJ [Ferruginibacter sp.]